MNPTSASSDSPATLGGSDPPEAAAVLAVLDKLAALTGTQFDLPVVRRALNAAVNQHPGSWSTTWQLWLELAGESCGLHLSSGAGRWEQIVEQVTSGAPLVVALADAHGFRLVLLLDLESSQLLVFDPFRHTTLDDAEWRTASEIRERVFTTTQDTVPWAVATPLAPCDLMSSCPTHSVHSHEAHGTHLSPWERLLRLLRPEWTDIRAVVLFAFAVGLLALATPITVEALVNTIAFGGLLQPVVVIASILFCCLAFANVLVALQTYLVELIQRRLFVRVVADLAQRLPRAQLAVFDEQHGPELVNRFFDVLTVQKVTASLLLDGLAIVLSTVIGMIVLAFYHPLLLGYDIVLIVMLALLIFVFGRGAVRSSITESRAKYAVAGWLEEIARHPQAFRTQTGQRFAFDRADSLATEYLQARQAHFRVMMRQIIFLLILQTMSSVGLLGLGGWLVINGQLTLGQLVAAELIIAVVVGSLAKAAKHFESYYDLLTAVDKLGHLIDLPLERHDGESLPAVTGGMAIALRQLSFRYPHGGVVFENLNWIIQPGERVAVYGSGGSGKSTLIDLLIGLREPTGGQIDYDGIDLRQWRLDQVRTQVAIVRGNEIFAGTIEDNVRLGRDYLSLHDIRRALADVGLSEPVGRLPAGTRSRLVTGGLPLSGSQVQQLMLARAIVGQPRLLILDETLDSMDPELRETILPKLFDEARPWTVIMVTSRLTLAAQCPRQIELALRRGRS